jgi:hypothetical protein
MRRSQGDRRVLLYPGAVGTRGEEPAGKVDDHDRAALVAGEKPRWPFIPPLVMMYSSASPGSRPIAAGGGPGCAPPDLRAGRGGEEAAAHGLAQQGLAVGERVTVLSRNSMRFSAHAAFAPASASIDGVGGQLGEQAADLIGIGGL